MVVSREILRGLSGLLIAWSFVCGLLTPEKAQADPGRDFIVSCSYGVLAGTMVGAATLAFSDKPGENLNKVARGASLGLYAGMLLGVYVIYGGPIEDEDAAAQLKGVGAIQPPRLQVFPLLSERGVEGAEARYKVLEF